MSGYFYEMENELCGCGAKIVEDGPDGEVCANGHQARRASPEKHKKGLSSFHGMLDDVNAALEFRAERPHVD